MLKEYRTILEPGTDEIVEKKSRFIGYIRHTETEEEANAFINEIRKKHFDARHNCFAYSVDGQQQTIRFSDDGEPGGTAGKPILEVITGKGLCDVCIVVTRYFGGTLLGTGGLVRAYTDAAKACIDATDMVTKCLVVPMRLTTNYTDFGKIQYLLGSHNISVLDSEYGENVAVRIEVLIDDVPMVIKQLTEVTAARVQIEQEDAVYSVR